MKPKSSKVKARICLRCFTGDHERTAVLEETALQSFDETSAAALVGGRAFQPQEKRNRPLRCPPLGLPGGEVVVAAAEDCVGTSLREGVRESAIEEDVVLAESLPGRQGEPGSRI